MDDDAPQGPWYPPIIYSRRGQSLPAAMEADHLDEDFLWLASPITGNRSRKRGRVAGTTESLLEEVTASDALQSECAVCLQDFDAGETLRAMPCSHAFHHHCISEWLSRKASCPLCRRHLPAAPTPTPEEQEEDEEEGAVGGVEWVDTSGEVEWVDGSVGESS